MKPSPELREELKGIAFVVATTLMSIYVALELVVIGSLIWMAK